MAQGVQVDEPVQELLGEDILKTLTFYIKLYNLPIARKCSILSNIFRPGWLSAYAPQHLPNRMEEPEGIYEAAATRG